MMRMMIAALILCAAAQQLAAGAWLSEKGTGFASFSTTVRSAGRDTMPDYELGIYGTYGLTSRLTIGLDINEVPGKNGHALLFARLPLGPADGRARFAFELALGGHHRDAQWGAMFRTGLGFGYGFSTPRGNGWLAIDAAYEIRRGNPDPVYKLDGAVGLPARGRFTPFLQIETSQSSGRPLYWSVTPSVIIAGKGAQRWVFGVERRSTRQDTLGLTLRLWRDF